MTSVASLRRAATHSTAQTAQGPFNQIRHWWQRQSLDRKLVLLGGATYIPTAIVTPIVSSIQLSRANIAPEQRRALVVQEWQRQWVSSTLWLVPYYGGLLFAKPLGAVSNRVAQWANKRITSPALRQGVLRVFGQQKGMNKNLAHMVWGIVMATITHGLMRPIVTNKLVIDWLQKHPGEEPNARLMAKMAPQAKNTSTPSSQSISATSPAVPQATWQAVAFQSSDSVSQNTLKRLPPVTQAMLQFH